jgi:hypothetical protein
MDSVDVKTGRWNGRAAVSAALITVRPTHGLHSCRIVRQEYSQGQGSDKFTLVERLNRRTDHQAQAVKRQMYRRGKIDLLQARVIRTA